MNSPKKELNEAIIGFWIVEQVVEPFFDSDGDRGVCGPLLISVMGWFA